MTRDIENSRENSRLIALNLAMEAVSLGESGRQLFEFACQSLEYSDLSDISFQAISECNNLTSSDPETKLTLVSDKA